MVIYIHMYVPTCMCIYMYIYVSMIESKKQNEQAKQKHNHRHREHFDGGQIRRWLGGWAKKVKGLRSTNSLLQNSHEDVKYSIGNLVNNIPIIMYGVRWVQDLSG